MAKNRFKRGKEADQLDQLDACEEKQIRKLQEECTG